MAERITENEIADLRLHRVVLHAQVVKLEARKVRLLEEHETLTRKIRRILDASDERLRKLEEKT